MPIKGLSEKRMIPRLGKIRLGIKKTNANGKEYPVATDYFVLPKDHPNYPDLVNAYGEFPKSLNILIPTEDEEKWCSQYYRCYSRSRGLVCKGDGETATRMVAKGTDQLAWKDAKEVEMKDIACTGRECEIYMKKNCNEIMNMQFMLPEIPGLGVWQIDTTSINSIRNINSAAELIQLIYHKIAMIPLTLTLEPREVNNPDDGKKKTVHVLNLRVNMKLSELAIAARQQSEQFMLPIGDTEPPDDGMRFAPDFDPITPDTHTPEENIRDLWPDAKPAAKPVEVIPSVKPTGSKSLPKSTKAAVDATVPLTDADFDPTPVLPTDPVTVEGTPEWIVNAAANLKVDDAKLVTHILNTYHVPTEEGPVINTVKQMSVEQRAEFTAQLKRKLAEKAQSTKPS